MTTGRWTDGSDLQTGTKVIVSGDDFTYEGEIGWTIDGVVVISGEYAGEYIDLVFPTANLQWSDGFPPLIEGYFVLERDWFGCLNLWCLEDLPPYPSTESHYALVPFF